MSTRVSFDSPFYPYSKPNSGFNELKGAELIPNQLIMYLLDLPDKYGYVPVDDNSRPRVRLMKYLYYDESNPLSKPLPTPEQKLSLLYNGENTSLNTDEDKKNHPKGYRIFGQQYEEMSEINARTMLRCYMAREIPRSDFKTILGVDFSVVINYALDNTLRTDVYSRMYAIHQCLIEAFHGLNMTGIGGIHYNRSVHGDSGYTVYHGEGQVLYSDTFFGIDWQETTTEETIQPYCD